MPYFEEQALNKVDRRAFIQLSTGAVLTAGAAPLLADESSPRITSQNGLVRVAGANYTWEYSQRADTFTLRDSQQRVVVRANHQLAVVVAPAANPSDRITVLGQPTSVRVEGNRVVITYESVHRAARVSVTWRFDKEGIWTEPITYDSPDTHDIVSLHYFAAHNDSRVLPALHASFYVVPGISESGAISPIQHNGVHLDESFWLGRGSALPGLSQQWALPVHYFAGFSTPYPVPERDLYTKAQSDAFACGLADLPGGDLFLQFHEAACAPWIDYRSDIWHHLRTPGSVTLGATLLWTVAPGYYEAIAAYYDGLIAAGVIKPKHSSPAKAAVTLTPEFCTWGPQRERDRTGPKLDEAFLNDLYADLKSSGMNAGLFSIDDKWESSYGTLEHSATRLPHFEQFLAQVRADGRKIGMWAALMRCERPEELGLTLDHMLKQPDGKPFTAGDPPYYLLDFTQPLVAEVLDKAVRKFIHRYSPDVFKFDFGYELPALSVAAPKDMAYAGERLMKRGLDVVITAMKQEKPDLVVMYYNLSPLFLDYFDLHSLDDLVLNFGDYDVEANRRIFFSSLMGRLGVPTYGSTGYDWATAPHIWFDSAAVGTIGSLNDFRGDEQGEVGTPEIIARYNGIARILRPSTTFEIVPIGAIPISASLGAHARSWARFEGGNLVLLAWRPYGPDEESPLATNRNDSRIKDAVRSSAPVVVASPDSYAITRSSSLGIVFYGGDTVDIRRTHGSKAAIVSHYFGGATIASKAAVADGRLKISVAPHDANAHPLEWVEVNIS
ncbi:alpha-amylase family protein [Granulicella aggregans]|uniref:hypothetical protein n=1 Tax=Granulicella aggregans TaxID=474949 RepID=UPI0021DF4E23|nr:hypothetical protein [Granulicella aggregans]